MSNILQMETKIWSYEAEGIMLEDFGNGFRESITFNRKALLEKIKEMLKKDNFKPDEQSIDYKIVDGQLYIEGLAVKIQEPKSIGFMTGS